MKTIFTVFFIFCLTISLVNAKEFDQNQVKRNWLYGSNSKRLPFNAILNKDVATTIKLDKLRNIKTISDNYLKGKYTLVDIWATWCGPCLGCIPKNNEMYAKYKEKLNIIGICTPKGSENFDEIVNKKGIKYPVGIDSTGKIITYFRAQGFPTYHLIDPNGKLVIADIKVEHVKDVLHLIFE